MTDCARCGERKACPWRDHDGYICVGCLAADRDEERGRADREASAKDQLRAECAGLREDTLALERTADGYRDLLVRSIREHREPRVRRNLVEDLLGFDDHALDQLSSGELERLRGPS